MKIIERIKQSYKAALAHVLGSAIVCGLSAALVFGLWYAPPYNLLAGGTSLFILIVGVDLVCGPLLTLVLFDRNKTNKALAVDIGLIIIIQLAALGYGLYSLAQARPVFLAYEANRYRVVSLSEIPEAQLSEAPADAPKITYTGPQLLGVYIPDNTAKDFFDITLAATLGVHPSFMPKNWRSYESQIEQVKESLKDFSILKKREPNKVEIINKTLAKHNLDDKTAGWLPLNAEKADPPDWVVVVSRQTGKPVDFIQANGW